MATNINWQRRFLRSGTAFTDTGTNDIKMYVSNNNGDVGAEVGSMTYTAGGLWNINIDIDTYNSNYYVLRYDVGAGFVTMDSAKDSGCAPLFIDLENHLPLIGGTMTGAIAIGDQQISGVNNITFNDTAGTLGGIANGNLIDKTADETITGAWTHSGDCTLSGDNSITGVTNFTKDCLLVNSVIAQPYFYINESIDTIANKEAVNGVVFTCDTKMTVISIESVHSVPSDNVANVTLQVERLSGVEAVGAGDVMLDPVFDMEAAADTIQSEKTPTNAALAVGDRIAIYLSDDPTNLAGLCVTIKLRYGN